MSVKFISEQSLIAECLKNNEHAQRELYEKYAGRMFAVCHRYSGNYQAAEDMLQDGFIKIFDNLKNFKSQGSFEGWMKRIVINTALETFRKRKIETVSIDIEDVNFDLPDEETLQSAYSVKEIMEMMKSIPEGYREVLNLFVIDGYAHKEIAQMLNISEANSKLRLNRARTMLKKIMLDKNQIGHEQIN